MGLMESLLGLEGVQATGGGVAYDPREDEMEVRFTAEGTPYNARPDTPLHPGHTKANQPMFNLPVVEQPTEPSLLNYGDNYYSDIPFVPQNVAPTNNVTQTLDKNINPMDLYNRQGRADYIPQDTYNPNTVFGDPSLESLPDPTRDAYAEQDYYAEQDRQAKIEAQYQALLKAQGIQEDRRAEWDMNRADRQFNTLDKQYEDDNALRVLEQLRLKEEKQRLEQQRQYEQQQELLKAETLENRANWDMRRADDQFKNLDTQYDINNQINTDDFGNELLNANEHGQTRYDINAIKQNSLDNLMMQDKKPTMKQTVTEPTKVDSGLWEGAKDLYTDFTKPDNRTKLQKWKDSEETIQGVKDSITGLFGFDEDTTQTIDSDYYKNIFTNGPSMSDRYAKGVDLIGKGIEYSLDEFADSPIGQMGQHAFAPPGIYKNSYNTKDDGTPDMVIPDTGMTEGILQGFYTEIPQETSRLIAHGLNLGAHQLGKEDIVDAESWAKTIPNVFPEEKYPELWEDGAFNFGRVGTQWLTGYGVVKKLMTNVLKDSGKKKFAKEVIASGGGGGALDLSEGNLSTFVNSTEYKNALTEFLDSKIDDPTAEEFFANKLKAIAEEMGLTITLGGAFFAGLKTIKSSPDIANSVKDFLDPKTWGAQIEGATDKALELASGIKSGGRKEIFSGAKGAERVGKTDLMNKAESLEKSGASKEDIWKETGFIRGQEGNLKFEIDDSQMEIKDISHLDKGPNTMVRLSEIVDHPKLFEVYPELKNMEFYPFDSRMDDDVGGYFTPTEKGVGIINMNPKTLNKDVIWKKIDGEWKRVPATKEELEGSYKRHATYRAFVNHELDHAVANIEGHAQGSSPIVEAGYVGREIDASGSSINSTLIEMRQARTKASNDFNDLTDIKRRLQNRFEFVSDEELAKFGIKRETALLGVDNKLDDLNKKLKMLDRNIQEGEVYLNRAGSANYRKVAGENSAFESQNRIDMTDAERRANMPVWNNVADEDAIIRTQSVISQGNLPWKMSTKGDGDFYIQRVGPNAGKVSKTRQGPSDIAFSTDQSVLLPDYAYYAVMNLEKQLQARAHGTAQQSINKKDIDAVLTDFFQNMKSESKVTDGVLGQVGKKIIKDSDIERTDVGLSIRGKKDGRQYSMTANITEHGLQIKNINVDHKIQGKGVGTDIYKEAFNDAKSRGLDLSSDFTVSEDALGLYKKLEKEGYDVWFNPNVEINSKGVTQSLDSKPVVVVSTKVDKDTRIALNEQKAEIKAKAKAQQQEQLDAKTKAKVDELGFYSKAEQALLDLKQEKNSPDHILSYLRKQGVTHDELNDTGLLGLIMGNKIEGQQVTRTGLLSHIKSNKTKLDETQYLGDRIYDDAGDSELDDPDWYRGADGGNVSVVDDTDYINSRADDIKYELNSGDTFEMERLFNYLHRSDPVKYPKTIDMQIDDLDFELSDIRYLQTHDQSNYVENVNRFFNKHPSHRANLEDGSHVAKEEYLKNLYKSNDEKIIALKNKRTTTDGYTDDWAGQIGKKIDDNELEALDFDIDDYTYSVAEADYLDDPFYEWNTESGYTATGNESIGITIKDPNGDFINNGEPVYSRNEANIQIGQHADDWGYQTQGEGGTKYSDYTQPGLDVETYREIPITSKPLHGGDYWGGHFDEDNVVGHLRLSDKTDADGKWVLFIEELQSDLHQQGRKGDYASKALDDAVIKATDEEKGAQEVYMTLKRKYEKDHPLTGKIDETLKNYKTLDEISDPTDAMLKEKSRLTDLIYELDVDRDIDLLKNKDFASAKVARDKAKAELRKLVNRQANAVPDFPLKNDKWLEMAFKRAIKIASDEGYDRVVWTNSQQQVNLYSDRYRELYENTYDNKLPGFAKRLANKHGSQTGTVEVNDVVNNYIDINPKLKDAIKDGQPMYIAPVIPAGGLLGGEETQAEEETEKDGILNNVKSWKPNNKLTDFVKMMENAPLAVGKAKVEAYDDVGHQAKGFGTKAGLLAQDTPEEATKALITKLIDANKAVDRLVKIDLNEDQRNALVSLVYNVGATGFGKSNALKALNNGNIKTFLTEAFDPKKGFVKSEGKISKGLVNRRAREKQIFTKGNYGN